MLKTGEATPIPAASVLVVRDDPFEVLFLQRHQKLSFAPNAWVFPGGIAEQSDYDLARELGAGESTLGAMRIAAARETFEESGIWLGAPLGEPAERRRRLLAGEVAFRDLVAEARVDWESLVWTSRWITPAGLPKRFDTWFFIATVPRDTVATIEASESVDVAWVAPADALERNAGGTMPMMFPTLRNLEAVVSFSSSANLIAARRGAVIEPVQPVLVDGKPALP